MAGRTIEGAGGIVWRPTPSGPEVVLVHRPLRDDWTLPIGRREAGESAQACALREVEEETGLRCELGALVEIVEVVGADDGDLHRWHLFMMKASGGDFRQNAETDQIAWLDVKGASRQVTYENFRELLLSLETRLFKLADGPAGFDP